MLKKINLDGIDYEAEESVIKALNSEKVRADNLDKELAKAREDSAKKVSELEAERDTQKERADNAEKELEAMKAEKLDSTKIDEAVQQKLELLENAKKANVEVKADMSDMDIKKAVIVSVFPKANFDGKDDVYIQARYDGALEMLAEKADSSVRQATSDVPEVKNDSNTARERMIENLKKGNRQ